MIVHQGKRIFCSEKENIALLFHDKLSGSRAHPCLLGLELPQSLLISSKTPPCLHCPPFLSFKDIATMGQEIFIDEVICEMSPFFLPFLSSKILRVHIFCSIYSSLVFSTEYRFSNLFNLLYIFRNKMNDPLKIYLL